MTKRKPVVGMSLKLYMPSISKTKEYTKQIHALLNEETDVELFLFPSLGTLFPVSEILETSSIGFGSQNVSSHAEGAYTGEFSIETLQELKGSYVELGHSERRRLYKEDDEDIADKVSLVFEYGITPVLCAGEEDFTDSYDKLKETLSLQLDKNIKYTDVSKVKNLIIAYEPVWAIGAEAAADAEYVHRAHGVIREYLNEQFGQEVADHVRVIYGGSVSKDNVEGIIKNQNVDGVFVGRFGHDPNNLKEIVETVKQYKY